MKAVTYSKYGALDVLKFEEVDKPVPAADEVLVKIRAAAVNFADAALVRGKPFLIRMMTGGVARPKFRILGADIAGTVETVGKNAGRFKPGDQVFADISANGFGGFAEYVSVPADILAGKPGNISFREAAAAPQAAVVALQGLQDKGKIESGQKVLVVGASGGIGTYAVQLAKYFGAEVTGVCSSGNVLLVRSLGADHVIDYTQEDFADGSRHYDLIVSISGFRKIADYSRALKPGGTYVMIGGEMKQIFQAMLLGPWLSMGSKKRLTNLSAKPDRADLETIGSLFEAGKLRSVIDKTFPQEQVPDALAYYEGRHARGKVVIYPVSN